MTYIATYRKSTAYSVGDQPKGREADRARVNIVAESQARAEVNARRIAADRGWCLLDLRVG